MQPEVRLERLRPADVRDAMAAAPIAWVPVGAIEFHAEHLPLGHGRLHCTGGRGAGCPDRGWRGAALEVVPLLHERGLDEDEMRQLIVRNPAHVLAIATHEPLPATGR